MDGKIKFVVGNEYENRKGLYEVISLDSKKKKMVIRWKNGEEVESPIKLQKRIIRNMQFNKSLSEGQKDSKRKNSLPKKSGSKFAGLEANDFKNNVSGTTWRSRKGLGDAVSRLLYFKDHSFKSWAISRMPETQWADVDHRDKAHANTQAKFYAHISDTVLKYGFCIERSNKIDDPNHDWKKFVAWLELDGNEKKLNSICKSSDLGIGISEQGFNDNVSKIEIETNKDAWILKNENKEITSLYNYLNELPGNRWIELNVFKTLKKDNVISKQTMISEEIASVFEVLMPLYGASILR